MNDEIEFKDLPLSYRLSQGATIAAVVTPFVAKKLLLPQWPLAAKIALGCIVVLVFLFALIAASYVVVRYPYLSLVSTRDGDYFQRHFSSMSFTRWIKGFGILATLAILAGQIMNVAMKPPLTLVQLLLLIYTVVLLGFMIYLTFFHVVEKRPAVGTFIRATLGLGILLVPIFIPVLVIGSIRCDQMLDSVVNDQKVAQSHIRW